MRKLPPELLKAKAWAEGYRVKPYGCSFRVWRFHDWDRPEPGWRVVEVSTSREAAEAAIRERLGLNEAQDPKPAPKPAEPAFSGHFDWSGM